MLLLRGPPISWKTKKQTVVPRSSAEVEYQAKTITVSGILWARWLLKVLQVSQIGPTHLFCDNQAARHIANNLVFHERTKQVEMDCHFFGEHAESKEIALVHVDTKSQIASIWDLHARA